MVSIEYMGVGYPDTDLEDIHYCDASEVGAFKRYKELKFKNKKIFKVRVTKDYLKDVLFIMDYKILEVIK